MSFRDDSWRDSYDNWKLATPPEYEEEQSEESQLEEDAWRAGYYLSPEEAEQIVAERRAREQTAEANLRGGLSAIGVAFLGLDEEIKF